ncbi:MAG: DEAD/DEAH box helicase, partial [Candidatus Sungbacteria bacterium]|nr:DEAD/DEAH box helicase [Candidatus Sungbacteria bacterium]
MSNTSPPHTADAGKNVAITPQFLDRGNLWFSEHFEKIKYAVKTESFWQKNAVIIEEGLTIKPGEFLRVLSDFGYEKTRILFGKGEYVHKGNSISVWPINSDNPFTIEFFGNTIEHIFLISDAVSKTEPKRIHSKKTLRGLQSGDYVVHVDHGIGIFRGITSKDKFPISNSKFLNDSKTAEHQLKEYFVVEYAPPKDRTEPDRLFVPTDQEKRLSPYIGFETPAIHRLGGSLWISTKKRTKEDAEKFARELIKIYAAREAIARPPYELHEGMNREFADAFEFTETEDQTNAVEDIKKDLGKETPMDRIICGDVGFGKTEVAMRAAFMAVQAGYQVAVITPTTVLAYEHGKNFKKRFEKFPVDIASLSRLTPTDDEKKIVKRLQDGRCDIVIGTHRLLSKDIHFKNLGLVVVDEEQKFGVKQKERFKELRSACDILSLSATPIPRTLNFALAGIREISTIRSAPKGRLPIKTFILPHSYKLFGRSIAAEIERGGQVYFLHNRIETIGVV